MKEITVTDSTVLLDGVARMNDNTSVYSEDVGVEVGYCTNPADPIGTFIAFPDPSANGNFRHAIGCFLCVRVTGTAKVLY